MHCFFFHPPKISKAALFLFNPNILVNLPDHISETSVFSLKTKLLTAFGCNGNLCKTRKKLRTSWELSNIWYIVRGILEITRNKMEIRTDNDRKVFKFVNFNFYLKVVGSKSLALISKFLVMSNICDEEENRAKILIIWRCNKYTKSIFHYLELYFCYKLFVIQLSIWKICENFITLFRNTQKLAA